MERNEWEVKGFLFQQIKSLRKLKRDNCKRKYKGNQLETIIKKTNKEINITILLNLLI